MSFGWARLSEWRLWDIRRTGLGGIIQWTQCLFRDLGYPSRQVDVVFYTRRNFPPAFNARSVGNGRESRRKSASHEDTVFSMTCPALSNVRARLGSAASRR